jgi:hypothetical protein
VHVGLHGVLDELVVQVAGVPLDDALVFERLDPPPDRGLGDAELAGDLDVRQAGVLTETAEDADIDLVDREKSKVQPPPPLG